LDGHRDWPKTCDNTSRERELVKEGSDGPREGVVVKKEKIRTGLERKA